MKRSHDYQQKHQENVGYDDDKDSTGYHTPTPTVPSPIDEICAAEEAKENKTAVPSDAMIQRAKAALKKWLSNKGFRQPEQELVLAKVERKTITIPQLMAATGRSRAWVYEQLKKQRVKQAIADLKNGKAGQSLTLPSESQATPSPVSKRGSKAIRLCDVKRRASELFKEHGGMDKHGPSDYWPTSSQAPTPTPEIARQIIRHIRSSPGALLSWDGRFFLETLVELLEAASWGVDRAGWCGVAVKKKRERIPANQLPYMPFVYSGWDRRRVAKAARKILEGLWVRGPGDSLVIPAEILIPLLDGILERVAELQAEWKSSSVGRKEIGLASFREAHATELRDFTELELRSILDGDLLQVACRLAEREVGVSAETFSRYHREARVRLRERPYAEGRLGSANGGNQ